MSRAHRLSEKDGEALLATCSVCGPGVKIRKKGKYSFACAATKRASRQRWAQAHPDRARRNRTGRSPHALTVRGPEPTECAICGKVTPVPQGRGWGCPNNGAPAAKRPQEKCPKCLEQWLTAEGRCLACDDRYANDLGYALAVDAIERRHEDAMLERLFDGSAAEHGFTIVDGETPLDDAREPAVHGWKTIGNSEVPRIGFAYYADGWSGKPKYIRPEYAVIYTGKG